MENQSLFSAMNSAISSMIVKQQEQLYMYSSNRQIVEHQAVKYRAQVALNRKTGQKSTRKVTGWNMDEFRNYMKCTF